MTGWTQFTLAMVLFTGSHFVPRLGGLREWLIGVVGRRTYFSVYGLLSLILLGWVIAAAANAPFVELWQQFPWTRWVPNLAMPVAVLLVSFGAGVRQPHTLGGKRNAAFDPSRPGFAAVSRHPLLFALALWALSHLAPNGDAAHVILFGSFALLALAAVAAFDLKARRTLGQDDAAQFFAVTSLLSVRPLFDTVWLRQMGPALLGRGLAALLLWLALLHLHAPVIGAVPFPL